MSDFSADLAFGKAAEAELDAHYANEFSILHSGQKGQTSGIDRYFCRKHRHWNCRVMETPISVWFTVEYKSDYAAHKTGNVFIELQQRHHPAAPPENGWALKFLAQYLIFYIPPRRLAYWIPATTMKERLQEWLDTCHLSNWVEAKNGYAARGLLLPIAALGGMATRKDKIHAERTANKASSDVRQLERTGSARRF